MKLLILILFVLFFATCRQKNASPTQVVISNRVRIDSTIFPDFRYRFSKRDSFEICFWTRLLWDAFNEKDLSVDNDVRILRLTYQPGALDGAAPIVLILRENELIIKMCVSRNLFHYSDTINLSKSEREDFKIFENYFPFDDTSRYTRRCKHQLDSICKLNPKLRDSEYYEQLFRKSLGVLTPFTYQVTHTSISTKEFDHIFNLLGSSGFWTLAYDQSCKNMPTDAAGFNLEGKNGNNFQMVSASDCPGDTSLFRNACAELVKSAGLQDRISVIWYE